MADEPHRFDAAEHDSNAEDPMFRADTYSEIRNPGSHGDGASPGAPHPEQRPHNREVENEMVEEPDDEGEPPRPATEPDRDTPS